MAAFTGELLAVSDWSAGNTPVLLSSVAMTTALDLLLAAIRSARAGLAPPTVLATAEHRVLQEGWP